MKIQNLILICAGLLLNINIFALYIPTPSIKIKGKIYSGPKIVTGKSSIIGKSDECIAKEEGEKNLVVCKSGKIFEAMVKNQAKGEQCPPGTFLGSIPYMGKFLFTGQFGQISNWLYCSVRMIDT